MTATQFSAQIGSRLGRLRLAKNLTQLELAADSGIGQSVISRIERGNMPNPPVETIYPLCQTLGIGLDELLSLSDAEYDVRITELTGARVMSSEAYNQLSEQQHATAKEQGAQVYQFGLDMLNAAPLELLNELRTWMKTRLILVTGTTGMGKTCLASALVDLIDKNQRIAFIDEIRQPAWFGHPRNDEAAILMTPTGAPGDISDKEAVAMALRMDVDYVVMDEIRTSDQALGLLDLVSTGHCAVGIIHGHGALSATSRLASLIQAAGKNADLAQQLITLPIVVSVGRKPGGDRAITKVEQVVVTTNRELLAHTLYGEDRATGNFVREHGLIVR